MVYFNVTCLAGKVECQVVRHFSRGHCRGGVGDLRASCGYGCHVSGGHVWVSACGVTCLGE